MAEAGDDKEPSSPTAGDPKPSSSRSRNKEGGAGNAKRKCVSTACIACRKRKSKCDGNVPSCAACLSVYGTDCVYDPNSDHRRKGAYKKGLDSAKVQDSTLKILIEGILNCPEAEAFQLVKQIRACDSLEDVAQSLLARNANADGSKSAATSNNTDFVESDHPSFERELLGKIGALKLSNGATQFLGGTSNLLYVDNDGVVDSLDNEELPYATQDEAIRSWTTVTADTHLIYHLINMYFTWHYSYFTTLSRTLFLRDFVRGRRRHPSKGSARYCDPLLVNAMLALGCHFTSWPAARADPSDSATVGDHFFNECKKILIYDEECWSARISTIQALALMSVREAGCGRETKGWLYSGISFRMAYDMGLPYETSIVNLPEDDRDARRMTFWGCYLFDKCWSNYLGRPPQLTSEHVTIKKFDVFPQEDSELWSPWTDQGMAKTNTQPGRTRAVALQITELCEISSDILHAFYQPDYLKKPHNKQAEMNKLSELQARLEGWRTNLPKEFEAKEEQLPQVLVMHMFFNLLFIHLFRPFFKYGQASSPLPLQVPPRKQCTQAAAAISKCFRVYKRAYGLGQICNIAIYILHSACTIHLLNQQDRNSQKDLTNALGHLEDMSENWLCARRTLGIIAQQVKKWQIQLPEEADRILRRTDDVYQISKLKPSSFSDSSSAAGDNSVARNVSADVSVSSMPNDPSSPAGLGPHAAERSPNLHAAQGRSSESAQRAQVLLQMQQNSLPPHLIQPKYQPAGNAHSQVDLADGVWRNSAGIPTSGNSFQTTAMTEPITASLPTPGQTPANIGHSPAEAGLLSPSNLFPANDQDKALYQDRKSWWLQEQSSILHNWMRLDGVPRNFGPAAQPVYKGDIQSVPNMMRVDMFGNVREDDPSASNAAAFDSMTSNVGMPAGWDNFELPSMSDAQRRNDNQGGFSTGIL